jgi:hypothetical protein
MLACIPFIMGWLFAGQATSVVFLYISRLLVGISSGKQYQARAVRSAAQGPQTKSGPQSVVFVNILNMKHKFCKQICIDTPTKNTKGSHRKYNVNKCDDGAGSFKNCPRTLFVLKWLCT